MNYSVFGKEQGWNVIRCQETQYKLPRHFPLEWFPNFYNARRQIPNSEMLWILKHSFCFIEIWKLKMPQTLLFSNTYEYDTQTNNVF